MLKYAKLCNWPRLKGDSGVNSQSLTPAPRVAARCVRPHCQRTCRAVLGFQRNRLPRRRARAHMRCLRSLDGYHAKCGARARENGDGTTGVRDQGDRGPARLEQGLAISGSDQRDHRLRNRSWARTDDLPLASQQTCGRHRRHSRPGNGVYRSRARGNVAGCLVGNAAAVKQILPVTNDTSRRAIAVPCVDAG